MTEQDRTPGTCRVYRIAWEQFLTFCPGPTTLPRVPERLAAYRNSMRAAGLSENTVHQRMVAIRTYFKWAHQRRLIRDNPLAYFVVPHTQKNPRMPFDEAELEPVIRALPRMPRPSQLILALGLFAGLRSTEIRHLKVGDIDLNHRVLHVVNSKRRKSRHVTIRPDLEAVLVRDFKRHHLPVDSYLIPSRRNLGQPISEHMVLARVKRELDGCAHQLRSTFITYCLEQGVPIEVVKDEVGHASISQTEEYRGRRNPRAREHLAQVKFG